MKACSSAVYNANGPEIYIYNFISQFCLQ